MQHRRKNQAPASAALADGPPHPMREQAIATGTVFGKNVLPIPAP